MTPDYAAQGYRAYVADAMTFWLDRGIAGFRLDSAWLVPHDFWRSVLDQVRRTHLPRGSSRNLLMAISRP